MKIILTSDTHENAGQIKKITQYALEQGIDTIVDCGDLHGHIEAFQGINLHGVYWEKANGAQDYGSFYREIKAINGQVHSNDSTFTLGNTAVYIRHNLADYSSQIPEERFAQAKLALEEHVAREEKELQKLILFGHTHNFHFHQEDNIIALNPGSLSLGHPNTFVILDLETRALEYRTFEGLVLRINAEENSDFIQVREMFIDDSEKTHRYIARLNNEKEVLIFDGIRSPQYSRVNLVHRVNHPQNRAITLDDLALAVTKENGKQVLTCQGKESQEYDKITEITTIFEEGSSSSETILFKAEKSGKQLWVSLDGKETQAYQELKARPKINQGKIYFIAKTEDNSEVLVQGWDDQSVELMRYKEIKEHSLIFSRGKAVAIVVNAEGKQMVNYGRKESRAYDKVDQLKFLKQRMAFVAREGEEEFVVVNGKELSRNQNPDKWSPSIDHVTLFKNKVTYAVLKEGQQYIVSNGTVVAGPVPKQGYSNPIKEIGELEGQLIYLVEGSRYEKFVHLGEEIIPLQGYCLRDFINSRK